MKHNKTKSEVEMSTDNQVKRESKAEAIDIKMRGLRGSINNLETLRREIEGEPIGDNEKTDAPDAPGLAHGLDAWPEVLEIQATRIRDLTNELRSMLL